MYLEGVFVLKTDLIDNMQREDIVSVMSDEIARNGKSGSK